MFANSANVVFGALWVNVSNLIVLDEFILYGHMNVIRSQIKHRGRQDPDIRDQMAEPRTP